MLISGGLAYSVYYQTHNKIEKIGILLIIAGAIGNVFDRICYGHVIDFISLHYHAYYWPTFNLADAFITCGAFLAILSGSILTQTKK